MSNPEINMFGTKSWYNINRQYHRLDGPAIEWEKGCKKWFINDIHIYTIWSDGTVDKGDMNNIPKVMKQSIIEHTLKLHI
jgi:hypothetical protein